MCVLASSRWTASFLLFSGRGHGARSGERGSSDAMIRPGQEANARPEFDGCRESREWYRSSGSEGNSGDSLWSEPHLSSRPPWSACLSRRPPRRPTWHVPYQECRRRRPSPGPPPSPTSSLPVTGARSPSARRATGVCTHPGSASPCRVRSTSASARSGTRLTRLRIRRTRPRIRRTPLRTRRTRRWYGLVSPPSRLRRALSSSPRAPRSPWHQGGCRGVGPRPTRRAARRTASWRRPASPAGAWRSGRTRA